MDILSDVLQAVRLSGAVFFDVRACEPVLAATPEMSAIKGMVMPTAQHVIPFHIMLRGSCWVESLGVDQEPAWFEEGDIVIYPHGHAHVFVTRLGDRQIPDLGNYRHARGHPLPLLMNMAEKGPQSMRFVCGYLGCDAAPFNPLLEALPPQVIARRPPEGNHMEVDLIHAAVEESEAQRPGGSTVLARLSELLFVRVVRRHLESMPNHDRGLFAGLQDPNISAALELIHGGPERDWTLEGLARGCGMSRAAFAERFADRVGETPMRYLGRWRMQLAARLLEQRGRSIDEVAEAVGYRSEAAFNRAFKNIVGVPPGAWRRGQTGGGAAVATGPDQRLPPVGR